MFLLLSILLVLEIVYLFYSHYYWPYKIQAKKFSCITGPAPEFVFGNLRQALKGEYAPKVYEEWHKKYGQTYLMYFSIMPVVITQDTRVIKDVLVKHFDIFSDRTQSSCNILQFLLKYNKSLPTIGGEKWKQMRRMISPNFTGKKLRDLAMTMDKSCDNLKEAMVKASSKADSIDVTEHFNAFSIEFILCTVLGRQCNLQNGSNKLSKIIVETLQKTFGNLYGQEKVFAFLSHFPILAPIVKQFVSTSSLARQWDPLQDVAAKIVKERKETKTQSRKDLLQFLVDAEDDSTKDGTNKLTEEEIIATTLVIVLSGVLHHFTYTAYLLALHPNVQDKLITEVNSYFDANPDATLYDAAENMEYVEMMLREVFRLYPGINMLA